jgi:ligand-binding sensor protein
MIKIDRLKVVKINQHITIATTLTAATIQFKGFEICMLSVDFSQICQIFRVVPLREKSFRAMIFFRAPVGKMKLSEETAT